MKAGATPARRAAGVALVSLAVIAGCGPKTVTTTTGKTPTTVKTDDREGELMPVPDPAPVTDGDVTVFYVNGLKVIHKRTPGKTTLAARFYFFGGVTNMTPENAGIERITLFTSTRGGTEKYSRGEYMAALEKIAATVTGRVGRDASSVSLGCLVRDFEAGFELLTEATFHPRFDPAELELQRERHLAAIASERDTPDSHVSLLARELFWKDHPYELRHMGTETNVKGFVRDDLARHHKGLLKTQEMLLVVVGDVAPDAILARVKAEVASLPRGKARDPLRLPDPRGTDPELLVHKKELPTHYVLGYFKGPRYGASDHPAALITFDILRHRLFEEVRTKKGLTYAVSSGVSPGAAGSGYLYTTSVEPNEAVEAILSEVKEISTKSLPDKEIADTVSIFITRHFGALETAGAQVGMLGSAEIYTGDWRWGSDLVEKLRSVTAADVKRVASTYIKDVHFVVLGAGDDINDKLFHSL